MQTKPLGYTDKSPLLAFACSPKNQSLMSEGGRGGRKRKLSKRHAALPTIWMPYLAQKPHTRRRKRIILRKFELSRKNAPFKGCAFWSLDQRFPVQQVIFGYRAGGDSFWWIVGEGSVFL
jgi:hypothetical protein